MANGPKQKFFGSLTIPKIKEGLQVPAKVGEYNGEQQLKVSAAQWDDDGISISVWDAENKREIKVGNLRVSTLDSKPAAPAAASSDDSPF